MMTDLDTISKDYIYDVAKNATCDRLHVGALIVDNEGNYLGSGFNRAPLYMGESCEHNGHLLKDSCGRNSCKRTIHAEITALHTSIQNGYLHKLPEATIYVTHHPCDECKKTLLEFGIRKIRYFESYSGQSALYDHFFTELAHIH